MRAVRYAEFGPPSVLNVENIGPLEPKPNEVRVSVEAAGVNPCDALRREGLWDDELPMIPGSDFAGVVEATGGASDRYNVGDRVFGTVPMLNVSGSRGDRQGTYVESVVVRTDRIAPLPEDIPFEVGGAIGIVGCTAWKALVTVGELKPGDTCFVHGGTGGVGHVAIQLAKAIGANVVATAGESKLETAEKFGADLALSYDSSQLEEDVLERYPNGPDVILDHRFGEYAQFDVNVANTNCTVAVIGGNYDQPRITDLTEAIGKDVTIQPFDMFNLNDIAGTLGRLSRLLRADNLTVHVAETFGLGEAADAHRTVMEESFVGKIVVTP